MNVIEAPHGYEVLADTRQGKLWINGPDGSSFARFNMRTGIDIHRSATEQMAGGKQCLHCTHSKPTQDDWVFFQAKAKELWGITLPSDLFQFKAG